MVVALVAVAFALWASGRDMAFIGRNPFGLDPWMVRKAVHLAEYAVLGFLIFLALGAQSRSTARRALLAFTLAVVCGVLDEASQRHVPARSASPLDVALDATGAALGQLVALALGPLRRSRGAAPPAGGGPP
ncbi:MAG: VanZ family protein [Candidatus Rokubacteria bacterium]|nr:VanZ family protein [Candidatus Rokubacteria bacterium]